MNALGQRLQGDPIHWGIGGSLVLRVGLPDMHIEHDGAVAATRDTLHFFRKGIAGASHESVPLSAVRSADAVTARFGDGDQEMALVEIDHPSGPWGVVTSVEQRDFLLDHLTASLDSKPQGVDAARSPVASQSTRPATSGAAAPLGGEAPHRPRPLPQNASERPPRRPPPRPEFEPPTRTVPRPNRRLDLVVGVIVAAVLAVSVAVGLLATGVLGGGSGDPGSSASEETSSERAESDSRESDLETYDGNVFTARVPAGWTVTRDAEQEPDGRTVTEFADSDDPARTVLIDAAVRPFTGTPRDSAQTIEGGLAQEGSRSLGIHELTVGGQAAAELRYEASEDGPSVRKADIFFAHGGRGFAVLGESAPEDFDASLPVFREIADTVRPKEAQSQPLALVLGAKDFVNSGIGWGTARPSTVHNGGSPSGMIKNIRWASWGGATAEGRGETFVYDPGGGYAEELAPIRLRAHEIGNCGPSGPPAYRQLSVSRAAYPGDPFEPWERWSGVPDLCKWR